MRGTIMPFTWSTAEIFRGSMVCFCMLAHPWLPRLTPLPQYSQVITISPNFGEIGAPQLGHFSDVAFGEAMTCSSFGGEGPGAPAPWPPPEEGPIRLPHL